jgi:hypothetical protein
MSTKPEAFEIVIQWISMLAAVTCLLTALVHGFWTLRGRWGRFSLVPRYKAQQIYRQDGISNAMITSLFFFMSLVFFHRPIPHWLDLTPMVQRISLIFFSVVLSLRMLGDFRHVGFFHKNLDLIYLRRERRIIWPLLSLWLLASLLNLFY